MSPNNVLVSVIIVTYNTKYYMLKEAIESILKQTYQDFELIIIDDKSEKYSDFSFLDKYNDKRIRFFRCMKNRGLAYCTNWGINLSRGKYIARLDSDDIALPKRLECQVDYLENNIDAPVLVSRGMSFGERFFVAGAIPSNPEFIRVGFLLNCGIVHSTAMFRKSYLINNDIRYNASIKKAQDYDLWARISEQGDKIHMLNKCLCLYRIHPGQASDYRISKEQRINSLMIKRRILESLYNPSETDYLCQESLGFRHLVDGISVDDIHRWIKTIVSINKSEKKYEQRYLKLLLVYKYCSMLHSNFSLKGFGFILLNYPFELFWTVGILIYKKISKGAYIRYIPNKYR